MLMHVPLYCVLDAGWCSACRGLLCGRYQPKQPGLSYQMAELQELADLGDGISVPSMVMLEGMEERFSFRSMMSPQNTEPSTLSGFIVNIAVSVLGR